MLSALMLPFVMCVRVIRRGDRAHIVQLRPPELAMNRPTAVAAWVWNIRAQPRVSLRMRGNDKGLR